MQDALNAAQHNLAMALLGLRRHPQDNSEHDVERLIASLPPADEDILYVVADEIDAAASRCRHRNFAQFHEYERVRRHRAGEIKADFLRDGLYHRPSLEQLKALLEAAEQAAFGFGVLRAVREVQAIMKRDGAEFDYEAGIVPAAPEARP